MDWTERYQNLSPIRESFKGALFLAEDKQTLQTAVCRVLYHTTAEHYQMLRSVSNPHLPKIFEVIQEQDDAIVVEEYIPGETLEERLKRGDAFSLQDIVSILYQLCEALQTVHARGIVHRDIKPANILLNDRGVVLIDFDAARRYQNSSRKDTVYMGTEGYAAPEQYGFAQTDCRSDIYSLGVVLRELCGEAPYHPLAFIIRRCMAFDPANRYQSVDEIIRALQASGLTGQIAVPVPEPTPVFIPASVRPVPASPKSSSVAKQIKRALAIVLTVVLSLFAIILLLPNQHEVTPLDYLLSKLVYLQLVIFPAVILFHLFGIWKWLPLLNSSNKPLKVLGVVLYLFLFLVAIIGFNVLAYAFYSPEALGILKTTTAQ